MAQLLRASVPSTQVLWLTTTSNSISKEPNARFWPLRTPACMCKYTQRDTQIKIKIKSLFKKHASISTHMKPAKKNSNKTTFYTIGKSQEKDDKILRILTLLK